MRARAVLPLLAMVALVAALGASAKSSPPKASSSCTKAQVGQTVKGAGGVTLTCMSSPNGKIRRWVPGNRDNGGGSGGGSGSSGGSSGQTGEKPVLQTLQVRIGAYDAGTGKAGDLLFSKAGLQPQIGTNSVFLEFGHPVFGQQTKRLPHFTFYAPLGTQVLAPSDGIVVSIDDKQGESDKGITISPSRNSGWGVNLDHITNLAVKVGDTVHAGEVLGTVGVPKGTAAGWGANELSIKSGSNDQTASFVCPWQVWNPSTLATAQASVTRLMADWESWYGDTSVYDEAGQISPGCDAASYPTG